MTDFNMLNILKKFNSVGTKQLSESTVTECGGMSSAPNTPVTVNLSAGSAGEMAMILRALSGIESSGSHSAVGLMASPMDDPDIPGQDDIEGDDDMQDGVLGGVAGAALGGMTAGIPGAIAGGYLGHKTQQAADRDESMEEWNNEPEEEYSDHKTMTKTLSGGINRQKQMFKPAAKGDNPMAAESIKTRLLKALSEKKAKPDFLDMDKDGDKKEPMKKAVADKKKAPVKEVSSKTRQSYTKAANASLDKALDSGDKKTVKKRDSGLDLAYDKKIRDMKKDSEARSKANEAAKPDFLDMDKDGDKKEPMKKAVADKKKAPVKEGATISPKYIKHLQLALRNWGPVLSRSEARQLQDILDKQSIANIKTIMNADIPHLSQMAKLYLRNKTPGGMINYKEAEVQAPNHELDDTARKAMNIAQKIKRKINSGEEMDDRDYNQMAELGAILSRFGTSFGPKSMKDVMAHMVQYTNDRNEEGHGYPEFNVDRFKELIAMSK